MEEDSSCEEALNAKKKTTQEGKIKQFILALCSSTAPSLFPLFLFPVLLPLSQQSRTLTHTPAEGGGGAGGRQGWFPRFHTRRK